MRKNEEILAHKVRVVTDSGNSVMSVGEARALATSQNLDLIQIQDGEIPVCKIVSWDKYRYDLELAKKERDRANRQAVIKVKEIQLRPGIGDADLAVKTNKAISFINDGDRVQIIMVMRGREITHSNICFDVMNSLISKVKEDLGDKMKIVALPNINGKKIFAELAPASNK